MTLEMLEAIRKKAEAFPILFMVREEHYTPPDVIVTPIEDYMLAKDGQMYPRGGGQVYLGHTEASFSKAEAEFIMEARADILALVAEVERFRLAGEQLLKYAAEQREAASTEIERLKVEVAAWKAHAEARASQVDWFREGFDAGKRERAEWSADSFKRGAHAMREAAADAIEQRVQRGIGVNGGTVRDVPLPEDK